MTERQTNYTIAEGYKLPSNGVIYDTKVNPIVELRSMTARDELKRLNPSVTPLKTLADIIEGCLIEKPAVHVYDMALADYEYLLHKLRIISYGQSCRVTAICPSCGAIVEDDIDLETLDFKELDLAEYEELKTFVLPNSGKSVSIKYSTPRLVDEAEARAKAIKNKFRNADFNLSILSQLCAIIDRVDGVKMSQVDLEDFVLNLPAIDMQKILNNYDKLNKCFGLDASVMLNCKDCGGEVKTFFRAGSEFFRPTNI